MHQNLAIILWQFKYGKNSFIALITAELDSDDAGDQCCKTTILLQNIDATARSPHHTKMNLANFCSSRQCSVYEGEI